ncbi:MAG: hypothetical protein A2Z27_03505 [candidate division Zixibacteria bacterium RBG_16_50_21]|nr:MAG: hypothetical protein A2Z27_03505 [candidate division Zixibacteria bacterium RBG_16_50_21]
MEDKTIEVLLIEDNPDDAELIRRKLSRCPTARFEVTHSKKLQEGMEHLNRAAPDVILVDLGLPDSHGLDTVSKVLNQAPRTPVVVLSGLDDEATAIKAVKLGAQDYLVKGQMENSQLERSLFYAIERARLQEELDQYTQELWKTEANLRKILEKNAYGIIVVDENKHILFTNPAAEAMMGCQKKELLRQCFSFPLDGGKTSEIEIRHGNQDLIAAEMRVVNINWEGKPAYLVSLHDITKRKETEEKMRHLDRMKSEFLSNVSHELRTPLQSISGFTKLIMNGQVPDLSTQQEFLQIIDRESLHLGNLINSLLDMSRLESGRFQINPRILPVREPIFESVSSFHSLAREKNIELIEDIPEDLPEMEVDGERLRQVVINLLSNAIKFSDPGSTVSVKAGKNHNALLFQVSDHGIGIPEDAMAHLFERFYRAEGELVRGGTGLGLYISKQIIEAHGGRIWATSQQGEGSTFSFTLPLNGKAGGGHIKEDLLQKIRTGDTSAGLINLSSTSASGRP